MGHENLMLRYWWLIALMLLAGLFGLLLMAMLRRALRRWLEIGRRHRNRANEAAHDPWRESGERLIVPLPHTDKDDTNDEEADDEDGENPAGR